MKKLFARIIASVIGAIANAFIFAGIGMFLQLIHVPGIHITNYLGAVAYVLVSLFIITFIGITISLITARFNVFLISFALVYLISIFGLESRFSSVDMHWAFSLFFSIYLYFAYFKFWVKTYDMSRNVIEK